MRSLPSLPRNPFRAGASAKPGFTILWGAPARTARRKAFDLWSRCPSLHLPGRDREIGNQKLSAGRLARSRAPDVNQAARLAFLPALGPRDDAHPFAAQPYLRMP